MDFILYGLPAFVVGAIGVFVFVKGKVTGTAPAVRVDPGQAIKIFNAAIAGNKPMLIEAMRKAFELDLVSGSLPAIVAEWVLYEIQQRVADPSRPAPVIEAVAKFTGLTQEEVLAIVKEDLTPRTALSPIVGVKLASFVAAFLLLAGTAGAAYPTHFNADVRGPQRFEPEYTFTNDPPLMRDRAGQLVNYEAHPTGYAHEHNVLGPDGFYYSENGCYQNCGHTYYRTANGFWQRGPVRRFFANRQPLRRVGRGVGRVLLAPFRFFRRR